VAGKYSLARKRQSVKASGSSGASPPEDDGLTAAARVRTAGPDFSTSFSALQDAVRRACAAETQWQARVVVGLRAALEFAATDPAGASALTIQARRGDPAEPDRQDEVIAYFADLIGEVTPDHTLVPISRTDEGLVDSIATVVRASLIAGMAEQLPGLVPDLVYLTLMPYTGIAEARRWASAAPGL
jgi:hypothetical protein